MLKFTAVRQILTLIEKGDKMTDYTQIQVRQDTSARWASINPILLAGEFGYATDTKILKKGDGTTTWNNLPTIAEKATTLAGYGITDGANVSLSNLNADGQMVVDSQNGTISNCILEIPQNIKLTIENGALTLKAGSVITQVGSTYSTVTTTEDKTLSVGSAYYNRRLVVFPSDSGVITAVNITAVSSGTTPPETGSVFFDTDDKLLYTHAGGEWNVWNRNYPICIVDCDSEGNVTFAKDSKGRDLIFNGVGFVGHHAFVYPNVKILISDEFNDDGSLKSILGISNSLSIIEMSGTAPDGYDRYIYTTNGRGWAQFTANEVNDISELDSSNYSYVKNKNMFYHKVSNIPVAVSRFGFVKFIVSDSTVTDFTIKQPVRLATTEMLDKKQDALTFDSTPTQSSTNPVTSGGVYTALGDKQADITTLTGYDSTKTQTLKNVNGTLTWVDD